ncbi:type II CAAX prenyl endopeptidase Rce1 family protein [Embleya sp. NPDC020630]|uniref:CPBP family glutamic-type intramembrane protease n=1 Tax=Embleya sp. NPDC020630 TaxID=3363979 RepID=UPI003796E503
MSLSSVDTSADVAPTLHPRRACLYLAVVFVAACGVPTLMGLRRLHRGAADALGGLPVPPVLVLTAALMVLLAIPAIVLAVRMRAAHRDDSVIAVAYMVTVTVLLVTTGDLVPHGGRRVGAAAGMALAPTIVLVLLYRRARPLPPRTRHAFMGAAGLGLLLSLCGYKPAAYLGTTVTVAAIVALILRLVDAPRPPLLVPLAPTVRVVHHDDLAVYVERPRTLGRELGRAARAYLTGVVGLLLVMMLASAAGALIAGMPDDGDKQRAALALDDMDVPLRIAAVTWTSIVETLVLMVLVVVLLERAHRPLTEIVAVAALGRVLVHLYAGTASLIIAALVLGGLSVLLYRRTRQVVPLIAGHLVFDCATVFSPKAMLPAFVAGLVMFVCATGLRYTRLTRAAGDA